MLKNRWTGERVASFPTYGYRDWGQPNMTLRLTIQDENMITLM